MSPRLRLGFRPVLAARRAPGSLTGCSNPVGKECNAFRVYNINTGILPMPLADTPSGRRGTGAGVDEVPGTGPQIHLPGNVSRTIGNFMIGALKAGHAGIRPPAGRVGPRWTTRVVCFSLAGHMQDAGNLLFSPARPSRKFFGPVVPGIAVRMTGGSLTGTLKWRLCRPGCEGKARRAIPATRWAPAVALNEKKKGSLSWP